MLSKWNINEDYGAENITVETVVPSFSFISSYQLLNTQFMCVYKFLHWICNVDIYIYFCAKIKNMLELILSCNI